MRRGIGGEGGLSPQRKGRRAGRPRPLRRAPACTLPGGANDYGLQPGEIGQGGRVLAQTEVNAAAMHDPQQDERGRDHDYGELGRPGRTRPPPQGPSALPPSLRQGRATPAHAALRAGAAPRHWQHKRGWNPACAWP